MHEVSQESRAALIGREKERKALHRLLAQSRIVTVTGPPGVGKSRLARAMSPAGPIGPCDLAGARGLDAVLGAIAAHLQVPGEAPFAALDRLGERVLVLDDLEPPDRETAAFLEELVRQAPRARLLVTCRSRLGLPSETCFVLGPLGVPRADQQDPQHVFAAAAVRLFLQRARALDPDYPMEPDDAPLLARLVRELDGLPLALELCAAQATVLSLPQLLQMLEARFDLLVGTDPGRHGSLRSAFEGSWSLLDPEQQRVLAACSVFAGGWDLAAAAAILQERPVQIARRLQDLHDRSWVAIERPQGARQPPRYHLLESIRAFAADKADEDLSRRTRLAHALYYAALFPLDRAGPAAARGEARNLEQAFRTAMDAGPETRASAVQAVLTLAAIEVGRSRPRPLRHLLQRALQGVPLPPSLVARGRLAQAILAASEGCHSCFGHAEEARAAAARAVDPGLEANVLRWTASFHATMRRPADAPALLQQARVRLSASRDPSDELSCDLAAGMAVLEAGGVEQAVVLLSSVARRCLSSGAHHERGLASFHVATAYHRRGDLAAARDHWEEAVRTFAVSGDERMGWLTRAELARLRFEQGHPDEAGPALEASFHHLLRLGFTGPAASVCGMLGDLELERGNTGDARAAYERCLEVLSSVESVPLGCLALVRLGATHALTGRIGLARSLVEEARRSAATLPGTFADGALDLHSGQLDLALAAEALAEGRTIVALQHLETAEERLSRWDGGPESSDMRCARRMLERGIAATRRTLGIQCLRVGPEVSWVEAGRGALALERRPTMRRLVEALLDKRRHDPGEPLSVEDLFRAGWPGERASWSSSVHRVHVMIARLRNLGIGELLEHHHRGYRLAPNLRIEEAPAR